MPLVVIIRINVAKHKREGVSLIDTLVHEELHILWYLKVQRTNIAADRNDARRPGLSQPKEDHHGYRSQNWLPDHPHPAGRHAPPP